MVAAARMLDRFFGLSLAGTTVARELRAGSTTFLTMAYILFVNPSILARAIQVEGADVFSQLLAATALAAAFGSLLMAVLARYPIALAPGMGINAYFAYTVVLGEGVAWQTALGTVFVSGVLFIVLSVAGIREAILNAIPRELRIATAGGIGLFLALIGLMHAGVVVGSPATLVALGDVTRPGVLLALFGLVATCVLLIRRIRGAILIGIVATSVAAALSGAPVYEGGVPFVGFGEGIVRAPAWPVDLFLELDVLGALHLGMLGVVFSFLFVDLFDTAGTLVGVSEKAGFLDAAGRLPRASAAFLADALATVGGALVGTSTTTSYIESAAGIEDGGRTGLVSVVVALLFLLSLFLWPLATAVPEVATAPALILVGGMMLSGVGRIDWADPGVAIPALLTIAGMPFTFSITNGISLGIIAWTLVNALAGRRVHPILYVLAVLLAARYVFLDVG